MSWPVVPIGDVCDVIGGGTPKTSRPDYWGGTIPWVTPKDLSTQRARHLTTTARCITEAGLRSCGARILPAESVLLSSRAPIGLVAVNAVPMATNQGFKSLVPDPSHVDPGFLAHWLAARTDYLQSIGTGATFKEISKAVVAKIEVPLPPVEEQRRISRVLDVAGALRAKRNQAVGLTAQLRQSLLALTSSSLPSEVVEWRALESLVAPEDRINYGVVQPGDHVDGGVPVVRVGDLVGGTVRRDGLKCIAPSIDASYRRSRIVGNEILVSCVGSIGLVAVTTPADIGSNIVRAVARIPIESDQLRTYIAAFLATPHVQRYFTAELRTVAQPTLNIKQIRALEVPVPTDDWLARFYKQAASIDRLRDDQLVQLGHLDALFASLQHRAFAGIL